MAGSDGRRHADVHLHLSRGWGHHEFVWFHAGVSRLRRVAFAGIPALGTLPQLAGLPLDRADRRLLLRDLPMAPFRARGLPEGGLAPSVRRTARGPDHPPIRHRDSAGSHSDAVDRMAIPAA